jgi:ribosomal protein S18 acetylase RimI-like enzyme
MKTEDYNSVHEIITQVHNLHLENRSDIFNNQDPFNKGYFESLSNDKNSILLVAENSNEITGICIATVNEIVNKPAHKDRKYICVEDICVDEKHRKNGIGKRLYQAIVEKAKEQKAEGIELTVYGFNKNAVSFYEGLGMNIKNIKYEQKLKT